MKKILLLNILFLISSMAYGYTMYSTSSYLHSRNTSVAYTQTYNTYNTGAYKTPRIGYSTVGYGRTGYYYGTYNPGCGGSTGSGRPGGQPRRVKVYDGHGNTNNTPGGNSDPDGDYLYDEDTGIWYYSPDGGNTWYEWRAAHSFWESISSDGLLASLKGLFSGYGTTWRTIDDPPGEHSSKWATDPNDPYLQPIGDIPQHLLILLTGGYGLYKYKKRDLRRLQKRKQS